VRPFRFGVQAVGFETAVDLRERARRVESLGYAELFTADHLGGPDPFLPLVVAAEATTTLKFGPLVINNEFHHTALLARAAATFDRVTGGRLVLGMGTGYQRSEHDAGGIQLRNPPQRVTRFEESLTVLRQLLDTGEARLAGYEVNVDVDRLGIRPTGRVPLLVGGHGRRVVGIAGRHADIYQFTGLTHDWTTGDIAAGGFAIDQLLERRRWLEAAAGDRITQIDLSSLAQMLNVTDDNETAESARREAAEQLGITPDDVDQLPFTLIGSVDEIVAKLERTRELLGIHHYVVRDPEAFAPIVERLAGT